MTCGTLFPMPINIPWGSHGSFFEKFGTRILIGTCSRAFRIPGGGRNIKLSIKFRGDAFWMSSALLVVTDTEASTLGGIAKRFATLNSRGFHHCLVGIQ